MPLSIYNTLSGQKEVFTPLSEGRLGIYVCGPTPYDMSHIGHARVYVAFDTIIRYLRRYFAVTYVRNFTDVDDKIIKRANELSQDSRTVSERFISEFYADMDALGVAQADHEPKVTEHIAEIIALVEDLIKSGHAYAALGDVYFAVESFSNYGHLGKREREDMEAGVRVEVSEQKKNPLDFALWKAAKPGEPFWSSPWGKGRPGWHIECSAMARKYLGESFDIHGGGKDLVFPHHENEIAQSEAASGKKLARFWLHNGFVNVDNEKMSKSLGNFFTIREVLKKFDKQTLRFYLLCTHYRSPINFSDVALAEAEGRVKYFYETLARLEKIELPASFTAPYREPWVGDVARRFDEAMQDDFNTAKAVGDLSEVFKLMNEILDRPGDKNTDARTLAALKTALLDIGVIMGLFTQKPSEVLERIATRKRDEKGLDAARVEALIAERLSARKAKDFARADAIRKELQDMGVLIKDSATGTTWDVV